jgi:hypothetical protein
METWRQGEIIDRGRPWLLLVSPLSVSPCLKFRRVAKNRR